MNRTSVNNRRLRVAVVSLYARNNYGNCLQRRAVHRLLEDRGCDVVSFDPRKVTKAYLRERMTEFASRLSLGSSELERAKRFASFDADCQRRKVNITNLGDISRQYDCFVVGSDQVWNPRVWDFNAHYNLLNFVQPTWKRIALAPSIGVSKLESSDIAAFREALSGYRRISVREKEGARIVDDLLGRSVAVLPDPTIALGANYWREVSDNSMMPVKPYVVVYELGTSGRSLAAASSFAMQRKLEVVQLNSRDNEYYAAGPADFVGLIFNAEAVFTDSFHALVFSILGHVPFQVASRTGSGYSMNSRIATLEEELGIETTDVLVRHDWSTIDEKLNALAAVEASYLDDELARVRSEL